MPPFSSEGCSPTVHDLCAQSWVDGPRAYRDLARRHASGVRAV